MTASVVLVDRGRFDDAPTALVERAVRRTLEREGGDEYEVSVALLSDAAIRELNRKHLGHDRVTDVIAFPLDDGAGPTVGDVYIGYPQARRQSREAGVSVREELVRLAVHGTLHVLGHDHPEAPVARAESPMYRRQERLVREVMAEEEATDREGAAE